MGKSTYKQNHQYKVHNWKEYNESLVNRGNLTIWFDKTQIDHWYNKKKNGQKGANDLYADSTILCMLTLKSVFKLPLRATEGLMTSIAYLMDLKLSIPDYTTLCRRQKRLKVPMPQVPNNAVVVMDGTGLKIYGEGEWKVKKHKESYRRQWKKLTIGVDAKTQIIHFEFLGNQAVSEAQSALDFFEDLADTPIDTFAADGAYDALALWDVLDEKGTKALIPPRENARFSHRTKNSKQRLEAYSHIQWYGKADWKEKSGYHVRSLSETAMWRIKSAFGEKLRSKTEENRKIEASINCHTLNLMTALGMPKSEMILK